MWSKRIFLFVLIAAAVTQIHAGKDDDDDNDGNDDTEPPALNQNKEKPESSKDEDNPTDNDEDDDDDEIIEATSSTTDTVVLEQTDTTLAATEVAPTGPPKAPDESYYVRGEDDKICVAMRLEVMFEIISKSSGTKNLKQPDRYSSSGDCGDDDDNPTLTIEHDQGVNLTFNFEKVDDGKSWAVTSVELELSASDIFQNDDESSLQTLTAKDSPKFSAPMGDSFSCDKGRRTTIQFNSEDDTLKAYAVISSVRMQAYDVPAEFGPERMCESDPNEASPSKRVEHRSDTAPIAVGLTMAILTLFGVTGFAVHRIMHQKKVDYSNV